MAGFIVITGAVGIAMVFVGLNYLTKMTSDTNVAWAGVLLLYLPFAILSFSFGIKQGAVDSDLADKDYALTLTITAIISVVYPFLLLAVPYFYPISTVRIAPRTKLYNPIVLKAFAVANCILVLIRIGCAGDVYETLADCAYGDNTACTRIRDDFVFTTRFTAHFSLLSAMFIFGSLFMTVVHAKVWSEQSEATLFGSYMHAFFVNMVAWCYAARELDDHHGNTTAVTLAGASLLQGFLLIPPILLVKPSRVRITRHALMITIHVFFFILCGFFYVCRLGTAASLMDDVIDCHNGSAKDCLKVIKEVNEVSGALVSQTFLSSLVGIGSLLSLLVHLHVWDWTTHRKMIVLMFITLTIDIVSFFYAVKHFRIRQYGFNHINEVSSDDRSTGLAGLTIIQPFLTAFLLLAIGLEAKHLPDESASKSIELTQK